MAVYNSKPVTVGRQADEMFERLTDLTRLQGALDKLPAEQREKVGNVEFTTDSIKIQTPQVGEIAFEGCVRHQIIARAPDHGTSHRPGRRTVVDCHRRD